MGRKKAEKNEKKDECRGFMDRLSLIVTLLVVSVFAIFTGYLVGQYAIHWIAAPIVGEAQQESSGTQFVDRSVGASPDSPSPAASPQPNPQSSQSGQASAPRPQQSAAPQPTTTATSGGSASQSTVFRVQVGHFATQSAAAAEMQALSDSVPDAFVVHDGVGGEYRVQVGAFRSLEGANEFAGTLKALGHDAFVVQ